MKGNENLLGFGPGFLLLRWLVFRMVSVSLMHLMGTVLHFAHSLDALACLPLVRPSLAGLVPRLLLLPHNGLANLVGWSDFVVDQLPA